MTDAVPLFDSAFDDDGWSMYATRVPSSNCDNRPAGVIPELLVIHNISLPPGQFGGDSIARFFCNQLDCNAHPYFSLLRELRVSAHFLIQRAGTVLQFVPVQQRAWHAGVSAFAGRSRCNDFSIGIELEGSDFVPFSADQYRALAALTRQLQKRYPLSDVAGHQHIAPGRKTDPGPFFDWRHYRELLDAGVSSLDSVLPLRFPNN